MLHGSYSTALFTLPYPLLPLLDPYSTHLCPPLLCQHHDRHQGRMLHGSCSTAALKDDKAGGHTGSVLRSKMG